MASNGMSRSKSRAHLGVYSSNNLKSKDVSAPNSQRKNKTTASSIQNSLCKVSSKKSLLLDSKKTAGQSLSRKGSRADLLKGNGA